MHDGLKHVHFDRRSVPTVHEFCCMSFGKIRNHWRGMHCMGLDGAQMGPDVHRNPKM